MVAVSYEDILVLIPFKVLYRISGTPTFRENDQVRKINWGNLIAVDCTWGQGKGQLGLLQYPVTFTARNGRQYDTPVQQTHTYPKIQNSTSTSNPECMRAKKIEDQSNWKIFKHSERIGVKLIYEAIKPVYYA